MTSSELQSQLSGAILPVTTPFTSGHEVDYAALRVLMEFYLVNGLRCFIAAGSTGQCYVLEEDEHRRVVRTIVDACRSHEGTFVLGACSHASTAVSNRLADICQEEGADALLLTPPYYRTHGDMCKLHYTDVARRHDMPLVIYHDDRMPEDLEMWDEIVREQNVLGVKFATGNIDFARRLLIRYRGRLALFGGGGMLQYLQIVLHGASGYVASFANVVPGIEQDFTKSLKAGNFVQAARTAELEYDLFSCMGRRSWFSFLVGLINASGLPGGHCRPPLPDCPPEDLVIFSRFLVDVQAKHAEIVATTGVQT